MICSKLNLAEFDKMISSDKRRTFSKKTPPSRWYHYRSWDSFWTILESDSFWATETGFSNDAAERSLGEKLRERIWREFLEQQRNEGKSEFEIPAHKERFIVCLSEEGDMLSQWRGYASSGGVSLGLDFSAHVPFTVFPKPKEPKNGYMGNEDACVICYIRPFIAVYCDEMAEKDIDLPELGGSEVDEIKRFDSLLPFIKHKGFVEEREWRLVVEANDFEVEDRRKFRKLINYRADGEKQIPFICIKPGSFEYDQRDCCVRIRNKSNNRALSEEDIIKILKKQLSRGTQYHVFTCDTNDGTTKKSDDTYCFGCTRRKWDSGGSPSRCHYPYEECEENKNEWKSYKKKSIPDKQTATHRVCLSKDEPDNIIISQGKYQEEVFNAVYEHIQTLNEGKYGSRDEIKVWCEGHLPIREIIVGPCANQDEMISSIKHYCRYSDNYWLRCINVRKSAIPYRTPIKS